jgi:hypothetical protein
VTRLGKFVTRTSPTARRRLARRGLCSVATLVALGASSFACDRCAKLGGTSSGGSSASGGVAASSSGGTSSGGSSASGGLPKTVGGLSEEAAANISGPLTPGGKINATMPLKLDCKAESPTISDTIFGVAWADGEKELGATAHRWGGNTTSRYNPKLGNAWSTARDWFWQNVEIDSWEKFVGKAADKGGKAAITIPMLGWVSKDTTSASFPVSVFGPQDKTDPQHKDYGNGKKPDGKTEIKPGDPSRTSVKWTPEDAGAWVAQIKAADAKRGKKVVYEYILDNEPNLWDSTHRDVHPEPLTYDELLEKTIAFGTAVRKADPDAVIAGPAAWGWPAYQFSAKDAKAGFFMKPDRRAHGDQPLLAWYLKSLAEHEKKTGVRVLDVLDVHFYPQGEGIQGPDDKGGDGAGETDRKTNERRYRATRALWDRSYVDESWIKEAQYVIPRMKDFIADNYPGRGLQIGEWNFGAEQDVAGAVALAEALGRFVVHGLHSAFYWTFPRKPTPAYWAFQAWRNYDGKGGHFLEHLVPTTSPGGTSLYASRDEAGKKFVAIALNFSADRPENAKIKLDGCGEVGDVKAFVYTGGEAGLIAAEAKAEAGQIVVKLAQTSITVIEWTKK